MSGIYDDWCTLMQNCIRVYLEMLLQKYYARLGNTMIFIRTRGHPQTIPCILNRTHGSLSGYCYYWGDNSLSENKDLC